MAHNTFPPLELSDAMKKQVSITPPTPEVAPPQTFDHLFTFPSGDVQVTVVYKGCQIVGKVVQHVLCLASPVWQKFLFPPWGPNSENNGDKNSNNTSRSPNTGAGAGETMKELDFSEDDGGALLLLLRIAHMQFRKVPSKLRTDELYQLALLCEQYDCHSLVQPWVHGWLNSLSAYEVNSPSLLYISWAFGNEVLFSSVAQEMVKHCEVGDDGQILRLLGNDIEVVLPDRISESILTVRAKLIDDILKIPYDHLRQYLGRSSPRCQVGIADCDSIGYGSLVLSLDGAGFWPEKTHANILYAPNELYRRMGNVRLHLLPNASHDKCSPRVFVLPILACLKEIPDPTLDCHRRHIERRAKELAFEKDE
ncbi:uncharacterized protein PAC_14592 [Phialocephala subalpina]|uniref:BTB domain-containing protein n=1 Tax=Phialocephala subalpina TaxID=576137 RepID=A0A1L7XI28_9HELO|nr:uncharacterized protein PAC_14592 [Phialocephala subalpina]